MEGEYQVLYRKYRPKDFSEVVGQEHVVGAVKNALARGEVAHAYLFSGPRGVGKTTIARLIARALGCGDMNIVEIDAASNRGIDEIRELREGVRFLPSEGKYKCYIIDEVHMLTKEAFNALLKTLEEPPAHAVFVLATTELEKVPPTIVSRTQRYDFRRPNVQQIGARLIRIAKEEGVTLEKDAAHLVALAGEGSMRDAESILGQVMAVAQKEIARDDVETILGLPRREAAKKMFEYIAKKDAPGALALVQELSDAGHDLAHFSKMLMRYFRNAYFLKTDPALKKFVEAEMLPDECECIEAHLPSFQAADLSRGMNVIFQNIQSFKHTPIAQLPLELTVIELIQYDH